jgi:hypothetical protein
MLASVLNSDHAIQVNVAIVRVFVKHRELLESHRDLVHKLDQLERKYDNQFKAVFEAIRQLMAVGTPAVQRRIKGLNEK